MRKIIAITLAGLILLSLTTFKVFADNNTIEEKVVAFKDKISKHDYFHVWEDGKLSEKV